MPKTRMVSSGDAANRRTVSHLSCIMSTTGSGTWPFHESMLSVVADLYSSDFTDVADMGRRLPTRGRNLYSLNITPSDLSPVYEKKSPCTLLSIFDRKDQDFLDITGGMYFLNGASKV